MMEIPDSKEAITCPVCGDEFVAYKSRDRTYCSEECQHKSLEDGFAGEQYQQLNDMTGENHHLYVEREEVVCPTCGDAFERRVTEDQVFCSRGCAGENRKNRIEKTCPECGDEFETRPSGNQYCSFECAMEYRSGVDEDTFCEYTCKVCGETFEGYSYKDRIFCSMECRDEAYKGKNHPSWKGGCENYYGSSWTKSLKKRVRDRDNRECQSCGLDESDHFRALDVHHITPFRKFGVENHKQANQIDNLISLCLECHMKVEYNEIECPEVQDVAV